MNIICLVDRNGSIVRTYECENINEAVLKAKLWKKLFPQNIITLNNSIV